MEHDSSSNKQLRNEKKTRAVMIKKIKILEVGIDVSNKKIYDVDKDIIRIQKIIQRRKLKDRKF